MIFIYNQVHDWKEKPTISQVQEQAKKTVLKLLLYLLILSNK